MGPESRGRGLSHPSGCFLEKEDQIEKKNNNRESLKFEFQNSESPVSQSRERKQEEARAVYAGCWRAGLPKGYSSYCSLDHYLQKNTTNPVSYENERSKI